MADRPDPGGRRAFCRTVWQQMTVLYGCKGVPAICADLQARYDIDVPVLLFACLADRAGFGCSRPDLARLAGEADRWRVLAVLPLRAVRAALKAEDAPERDFRDRVKALELQAESIEVARLAEAFAELENGPGGLACWYLGCSGVPPDAQRAIIDDLDRAQPGAAQGDATIAPDSPRGGDVRSAIAPEIKPQTFPRNTP